MRPLPILSIVFLAAAIPASAQVTVDLHALQALPYHPPSNQPYHLPESRLSRPPESQPSRAATLQAAPQIPAVATHQPTPPAAAPLVATTRTPDIAASPSAPPVPRPAMPESIPDTASITPISPPTPMPGAQPPPLPVVSDKAATEAVPTTTGLRLTFAPGESDLSPESSSSIKQLTDTASPNDATTFNVLAYAPGKPDDPSTARRISLSRAMTVRSALIADGVPSARIFVRALGEQYGTGPPDRVDVSVTGATGQNSTATAR